MQVDAFLADHPEFAVVGPDDQREFLPWRDATGGAWLAALTRETT